MPSGSGLMEGIDVSWKRLQADSRQQNKVLRRLVRGHHDEDNRMQIASLLADVADTRNAIAEDLQKQFAEAEAEATLARQKVYSAMQDKTILDAWKLCGKIPHSTEVSESTRYEAVRELEPIIGIIL